MSLPSPNYKNDFQGLQANYDRVMAPVPLRRGAPGYGGMTARIDGTITASQWQCMCGGSPNAPAYGVKWPETAQIDPTRAYLSQLNCTAGGAGACLDPLALTYVPGAVGPAANPMAIGDQLACVYRNPLATDSCTEARVPSTGCLNY